jgi:hypothetical protein
MSRSFRKPYIRGIDKWFKKYANRVARRRNWNTEGLRMRKMLSYDISDYCFYRPDDKKAYRK